MASFTDQVFKFRSFVQDTPVEDMIKVGAIKQQQYDQGVQRIQGFIDEVASLPVMRDVDKGYLQSHLNNMGDSLNKLNGSDFSNMQLQNSVGALATRVSKDPNVLAAVQSTEHHRNQVQVMEDARKKGLLTPQNEYNYQKQLYGYLSNPELGATFNGRYSDYFDVDKFARETFDAVKPDGMTYDQVYVTDANGKPMIDKATGKPVYSPTLVRLEQEGRFPHKVKQTIEQIFSDPRVSNQLNIDGEYNYRGISDENLVTVLESQKKAELAGLDEQMHDLQLKKNLGQDVQGQIDQLQSYITKTMSEYGNVRSKVMENPDAVRASIQREGVKARYTTMFGWQNVKTTNHSNPGWDANFKMMQEANEQKRHMANLSLAERKFAWDQKIDTFRAETDRIKSMTSGSRKDANGNPIANPTTTIDQQPSSIDLVGIFQENYSKVGTQYATALDKVLFDSAFNTPAMRGAIEKYKSQGKSEAEAMDLIINNTAKANKENPDAFRQRWYEKISTQSTLTSPTANTKPELRDNLNALKTYHDQFLEMQNIKKKVDSMQKAQTGGKQVDVSGINVRPVTIETGTGEKTTFSSQDIIDLALIQKGGPLSTDAKRRLEANGKLAIYRRHSDQQRLTNVGKTMSGQVSYGSALENSIQALKRDDLNADFEKGLKARGEILQQLYHVNPYLKADVLTGNAEGDRGTLISLSNMVSDYNTSKQNAASDFDAGDIMEVINAKGEGVKSIEAKISRDNTTGIPTATIVFNKNGKRMGSMVIQPDEAKALGIDLNSVYKSEGVRNLENRLSFYNNGTTSYSGNVDDVSTYRSGDVAMSKQDFPLLQNSPYDVRANITTSTRVDPFTKISQPVYYARIYVNDGTGDYLKPFPAAAASVEQLAATLQKIDTNFIQGIVSQAKNKK